MLEWRAVCGATVGGSVVAETNVTCCAGTPPIDTVAPFVNPSPVMTIDVPGTPTAGATRLTMVESAEFCETVTVTLPKSSAK